MPNDCVTIEEVEELVEQRVQEETADLRDQLENEREERAHLEEQNEELHDRVDELEDENEILRNRFDRRTSTSWDRIAKTEKALSEVQSLELEKGHHLRRENVEPDDLDVADGEVEFVDGDDGEEYARLPGSADPLERSGESVLSTGDLLPIQQLAQMPDEMLANATSSRGEYLAAKLWAERGTHSHSSPWSAGGPDVREFVDASDVRVWIKVNHERPDECLSDDWAKKLAGKAIEQMQEFSKHRGRILMRNRRKDGLKYKERRFVLDADAEIPGESTSNDTPVTDGVPG